MPDRCAAPVSPAHRAGLLLVGVLLLGANLRAGITAVGPLLWDIERQAGLMAMARSDTRALLEGEPGLTSPRAQAARHLLWLMEQDKAIRLITAG